ncbi:MAG: DNA recombination protein RmuC [Elusimicrobiaceae bacterium]|nr:DNA recombination protein RmuC [Elusimicrobiaceae bacterium]MBT4007731.1 DNA recombination protein RmuC [Elusimicrobiaceae bacterium]MBT4439408.1 DNA recombination protein RmuC [Elusimicrobiaceae bacterium]MBT5987669.1 DNA recombination protein RmuC [Elusimicrobiaceae bacterium]MBT6715748.1 DNA recombination protein RmuC [Elusimicrobiaceae bacterium]
MIKEDSSLKVKIGVLETQNNNLEERLKAEEKVREKILEDREDLQKQTKLFLENIGNDILERKKEKLGEESVKILNPFKTQIDDFKKSVDVLSKQGSEQTSSLKTKIEEMVKQTDGIGQDAKNLTKALRGDGKISGGWGEKNLETILEASGLDKEVHYFVESQEDRKRTDFFIKVPDNRCIVVDSKVSFANYTRYFDEENKETRKNYLKEHIKDVEKNINDLSGKEYWKRFIGREFLSGNKSPDFILMFVHPEPAFLLALREKPSLVEDAWKKNIALVSSTSLIHTLKLVEKLWKVDIQNKRIEDVLNMATMIHTRLSEFITPFEDVGDKLQKAIVAYCAADNNLRYKPGNLVKKANEFVAYGVDKEKINENTNPVDSNYIENHKKEKSGRIVELDEVKK